MERLPGFRDFYPEPLPQPGLWSAEARRFVLEQWRATARRYAFREYDGPPLEPLELFTTKSGEEIIGQLYNFRDKGQREVSLRPEMTPTLARMVARRAQLQEAASSGSPCRSSFATSANKRAGCASTTSSMPTSSGKAMPAADAELIALLIDTLRSFGLGAGDFVVRLSSRNAWHDFFAEHHGQAGAGILLLSGH